MLKKLRNPNILRFVHSVATDEAVYIVTEMVNGGELFDYAAQRDNLPEDECRGFMRQILAAVDYMHRSGVCHRDLKLENILLDVNGCIKIIDFGLGNFFDSDTTLDTLCGSADYAPPECWLSKPYYGPDTDVWSMA
jgi:serine/threonine protein kinase